MSSNIDTPIVTHEKIVKEMKTQKTKRVLLVLITGLVMLCLSGALFSAFINARETGRSLLTERLSEVERNRLEEAFHLRQSLGDGVWPGWGQAGIPIVVYNEGYAFLAAYPGEPPAGWLTVPRNQTRGSHWEAVPGETILGRPYFRQALPDPQINPQAFTVRIGAQYAASMQTWEYSEIAFVSGFRQDLPGFLQPIFPYRLAWKLLFGATETYLGGLEHEAFHAYQAMLAPERLAAAERAAGLEDQYPWEDEQSENAWQEELSLLVQAVKAGTDPQAAELARQFIAARAGRRASTGLSTRLVDYERQREWLEGLAKYAELSIVREAARTPEYHPLDGMAIDIKFNSYGDRERFFEQQVDEVGRMTGHSGEIRFYYSGMAQAVLLDRLLPGWKDEAFAGDVWLEDLLDRAVQEHENK